MYDVWRRAFDHLDLDLDLAPVYDEVPLCVRWVRWRDKKKRKKEAAFDLLMVGRRKYMWFDHRGIDGALDFAMKLFIASISESVGSARFVLFLISRVSSQGEQDKQQYKKRQHKQFRHSRSAVQPSCLSLTDSLPGKPVNLGLLPCS